MHIAALSSRPLDIKQQFLKIVMLLSYFAKHTHRQECQFGAAGWWNIKQGHCCWSDACPLSISIWFYNIRLLLATRWRRTKTITLSWTRQSTHACQSPTNLQWSKPMALTNVWFYIKTHVTQTVIHGASKAFLETAQNYWPFDRWWVKQRFDLPTNLEMT